MTKYLTKLIASFVICIMLALFSVIGCGSEGHAEFKFDEVAADITSNASMRNWDEILAYATPEFQALPDEAAINGIRATVFQSDTTADQWQIESTTSSRSIARLNSIPAVAIVFRLINNEWYYDPGPEAMFWAYYEIDENVVSNESLDSTGEKIVRGDEPFESRISERPKFTRVEGDKFVYATEVSSNTEHSVIVDLNKAEWLINGNSQPVQLLWASGSESSEKIISYPSNPSGLWRDYILIATPVQISEGERITLRFGEIIVGENDESFSVTFERTFDATDVRIPNFD